MGIRLGHTDEVPKHRKRKGRKTWCVRWEYTGPPKSGWMSRLLTSTVYPKFRSKQAAVTHINNTLDKTHYLYAHRPKEEWKFTIVPPGENIKTYTDT